MKPTDLSYYLSNFLTAHMAGQRNLSKNTVKAYRDAFVLLLEFFRDEMQIAPEMLDIRNIDKSQIEQFLLWLEERRGNSATTRNQRLAAIHAFFRYLQGEEPQHLFRCQKILSIPVKRAAKPIVPYLSESEMKLILEKPDTSTLKGRRDLTLLCVLYDTGARVQELCDLKVRNIRLDMPCVISLTGKGQKTRHVPLMGQTAEVLKAYLCEQRMDSPEKLDMPLFFNSRREKLTRQGVAYILAKYIPADFQAKVSPHVLRHTKAMHMTQADINPIYIRDFLGHADLKTTGVYSKASVEMKRKALEKLNPDVLPKRSTLWSQDAGLMDFLHSLE